MSKEILDQANEYVNHVEQQWKKNKWSEFAVYNDCEDGQEIADDILDEIAIEQDRTDPNGSFPWDQEEIFGAIGQYFIVKRSTSSDDE